MRVSLGGAFRSAWHPTSRRQRWCEAFRLLQPFRSSTEYPTPTAGTRTLKRLVPRARFLELVRPIFTCA
jgi:hypothetical protein